VDAEGTDAYAHPDVRTHMQHDTRFVRHWQHDAWSLGMTLRHVCCAHLPWTTPEEYSAALAQGRHLQVLFPSCWALQSRSVCCWYTRTCSVRAASAIADIARLTCLFMPTMILSLLSHKLRHVSLALSTEPGPGAAVAESGPGTHTVGRTCSTYAVQPSPDSLFQRSLLSARCCARFGVHG
jgi:hypothetical protein